MLSWVAHAQHDLTGLGAVPEGPALHIRAASHELFTDLFHVGVAVVDAPRAPGPRCGHDLPASEGDRVRRGGVWPV